MLQLKKWMLLFVGILSVILGIIGIFLPGLPTTPFILLAAACFARSSPSMHQRLLSNRFFGPLLADWEQHRSIPISAKWLATALMALAVIFSISYFDEKMVKFILAIFGSIGCVVVWLIPTRTSEKTNQSQ